jgi:Xaa-Pro aminopeptidase
MRQAKTKKVGYEENKFSSAFLKTIKQKGGLQTLVPINDAILATRMIKDNLELAHIRKACQLSDRILATAMRKICVGMTEKDIHVLLKKIALDQGVLDWSFTPIIGINAGASYPHYMLINDRKKIKRGDVLLIDMGAPCKQYQSDMTRTFFMGAPSTAIANQYEALLTIQQKTIRQIQVGNSIASSLEIFEKNMRQVGFLRLMSHALGHGVGLDVHELPHLSTKNREIWQKNMVIAIEPGIYFSGKYGMRIEDTCLVTDKGVVPLTKTSKELKNCILS